MEKKNFLKKKNLRDESQLSQRIENLLCFKVKLLL